MNNMLKWLLSFLLISFFLMSVNGALTADENEVHIIGSAPGFSGDELIFYTWTDQISFEEKELFRISVDENDSLYAVIEIDNGPVYIFSHAGVYFIYMYVEPGMVYQIMLPEKADKSGWEKLNPYFEGIPTHIAVLNHGNTELNALISDFDRLYEPLFGETLIELTVNRDRELLDSIHSAFNQKFAFDGHYYFNAYRRYKMAFLDIMAQMKSARILSDNLFRSEPVLYDNVAYMELFNQVYNRYFLFFSRTSHGSRIFDDINKSRSLSDLRFTLQTDPVLGEDRLLELVILKGLHDAFYGSDFSRRGLLEVLDSLAFYTPYPEHARIAENIRDKVTKLVTGFEPPGFELPNRDGVVMSLSDFRGYYVYLNFCTSVSYGCLSEYRVLSNMKNNHGDYLKIVTVFIDESYESMLRFLDKNDYDWEFLYYGSHPSVLKEYDVRMFPTYYLIDRDGKLLLSPAPSPAENFESYLLRIMRSRRELR